MVRFCLPVLALAILPGFATAQQPAESVSRTHVVVKGETLWGLAQRYYQDAFLWPIIFEANQRQIGEPYLIYPDQAFVIPGVAAGRSEMAASQPAVVGGVSVSGAGAGAGAGAPGAPPPADEAVAAVSERDRRSVFFRDPVTTLGVRGLEEEQYLLVSRASVWSAEWLGPENPDDIEFDGRIESFLARGELRTAVPYTRMRIALEDGVSVAVGDALQIYRLARTAKGVGSVMRPSGVVSITKVGEGNVEGVVLQLFGRALKGDFVRPAPAFDLQEGEYPDVVSNRTAATVVEFGESHALYTLGDVAILNRGGQQGVEIGDEYVAFQAGSTEEVVGRLRVVATQRQTASARIVSVEGAVFRKGIAVHLDRKMR